jgi:ABC-type dipeptide/oligopeptide/nickel transport system permease subunit
VLFAGAWWVSVFPGLALFLSVLAINSIVERRLDRIGGAVRRVAA